MKKITAWGKNKRKLEESNLSVLFSNNENPSE
jgi:hypothetical protein